MLDFPNTPTLNQVFQFWLWDGVKWIAYGNLPSVPIAFPYAGRPGASAIINVPMTIRMNLPAGLAGTTVYVSNPATLGAVFSVNKISGGSSTPLGTVTITPASATACTLAGTGGSLAIGDDLQVIAPSAQDATLSDVGLTLLMTRL